MTAPGFDQNNHYVPKFLQRPWCSDDGRLTVFTAWPGGRISSSRLAPEYTGFEPNLTALTGVPIDQRHVIEQQLLSRIDAQAAEVHRKILAGGLDRLTSEERTTFAHFLMSLRVRTPDAVSLVRLDGDRILREELGREHAEYLAEKRPGDPETMYELAEKHRPITVANFGLSVLPDVIMSEPVGRHIFASNWWVTRVDTQKMDLLLGDRPAILMGNAVGGEFILGLPLSPEVAFFASTSRATREVYSAMPVRELAMRMNRSTVGQAAQRIYATDLRHEKLVTKRLRRD